MKKSGVLLSCIALSFALVSCAPETVVSGEDYPVVSPAGVYKELALLYDYLLVEENPELLSYMEKELSAAGASVYTDDAGNLIADVAAAKGKEDIAPCTLMCEVDAMISTPTEESLPALDEFNDMLSCADNMGRLANAVNLASILSVAKLMTSDSREHGLLRIILIKTSEANIFGMPDKALYEDGLVIYFGEGDEKNVYVSSLSAEEYSSYKDVEMLPNEHKNAYVIAADGFRHNESHVSGDPFDNAFTPIVETLAAARSAGLEYSLCSISELPGANDDIWGARCIIALGDYEVKKFYNIFDEVRKSYPYESGEGGYRMEMIETNLPDTVIDSESTESILTQLYSLDSINSSGGAKESISIYFKKLDLGSGSFTLDVAATGDVSTTDSLSVQSLFADIELLSGMDLTLRSFSPSFVTDPEEDLPARFLEAYKGRNGNVKAATYGSICILGELMNDLDNTPALMTGSYIYHESADKEYIEYSKIAVPANSVLDYCFALAL